MSLFRIRVRGGNALSLIVLLAALLLPACEVVEEFIDDVTGDRETEEQLRAPSAGEIAGYFDYAGEISVEMSGNVAQVTVVVDREQYRRGGELWARAFPYIVLFSPGTRQALADHRGLGGVRAVVRYGDGTMVARALLERGSLTPVSWQEALNTAARARSEGSERPGLMRDLVHMGEDHTSYEYNPEYISGP